MPGARLRKTCRLSDCGTLLRVPSPKKPRKLPPRGQRGRFIRTNAPVKYREPEPELIDMPEYSPHRVGIGEPIDWQRGLSREVLPPRRRGETPFRKESNLLGWGTVALGAVGIGYALSRLPHKGGR